MRALVVHPGPEFSVQDVYAGWVEGLHACGVDVATLNLNDRLNFYGNAKIENKDGEYVAAFTGSETARMAAAGIKSACYDWWPDVLFIVSGFFVPPDFYPVFRDRGHSVVLLHTESPYEDDAQIARAAAADLNVINDPTNIDAFRLVAPTTYIPHGFDPARHHPGAGDPELACDFAFVGTGYPSRVAFFEQVDWTGIDATFAGNWRDLADDSPIRDRLAHDPEECCPNTEAVRLYHSAKASANVYRKESQRPELEHGWSMTPREVELAACGVFHLREPRGEGDEVLPMLPTFADPGEFGELLRWWTSHDEERDKVAAEATAAVADRTFENHARRVLSLLDR